jgi:hypothetical protein
LRGERHGTHAEFWWGKLLRNITLKTPTKVDDNIKLAVKITAVIMVREWNSLRIVSSAVGYISVNRVKFAVSTSRYVVGLLV